LTNGAVWQVYHITGGLPVVIDLALEVDLLGDEPPAHKVSQLEPSWVWCRLHMGCGSGWRAA